MNFFFSLRRADPAQNLELLEKAVLKEGNDVLSAVSGEVREGSESAERSFGSQLLHDFLGGDLEEAQVFDFACESAAGPFNMSVSVADSCDIMQVQYGAEWEPRTKIGTIHWEKPTYASEDDNQELVNSMNADALLRKSTKRLVRTKYVNTHQDTITIPEAFLTIDTEDKFAVLFVQTTLCSVKFPLAGCLATKFGIDSFMQVFTWLKNRA
jgi:hypothetical protein